MPTAGSLQEIAREHTRIHAKGKGGNTKFTCYRCNKEFTGSQTRQLAHLTSHLRLMTRFREPEKFAEWVEEIDEEQQEALLGLQDDEQFVPAFEMEDAADSDHAEESD